ncbi:DinB family protein [Bacillus sp. 1P06AnD]|uniref:DinB family protein n=1 Tax=Bacillus sp. 1P06AnD TaxID=3132208 RepID=UPI0039A20861
METMNAKKMYDYHVWANKQLFTHLKHLPDHVYTDKVKSVFPSVSATMAHIYCTDFIWLETMKGSPFQQTVSEVEHLKAAIVDVAIEGAERYFDQLAVQFADFFTLHGELDKQIIVEHPKMGRIPFVLADLVHHIVNHGTYHRGNVTAMLRQQSQKGIPTDYVFFLMKEEK